MGLLLTLMILWWVRLHYLWLPLLHHPEDAIGLALRSLRQHHRGISVCGSLEVRLHLCIPHQIFHQTSQWLTPQVPVRWPLPSLPFLRSRAMARNLQHSTFVCSADNYLQMLEGFRYDFVALQPHSMPTSYCFYHSLHCPSTFDCSGVC